MKRIILLALGLSMLVAMLSCCSKDKEIPEPEKDPYENVIQSGAYVCKYIRGVEVAMIVRVNEELIKDKTLTFPLEVNLAPSYGHRKVSFIGYKACSYIPCSEVVIHENISRIESNAFEGMPLHRLVLPKTVAAIGDDITFYNTQLKTLIIEDRSIPLKYADWDGTARNKVIEFAKSNYDSLYLGRECMIKHGSGTTIKHLLIGQYIQGVYYGVFPSTPVDTITFFTSEPPYIEEQEKLRIGTGYYNHTVLKVDRKALKMYKQHSFWGRFNKIESYN